MSRATKRQRDRQTETERTEEAEQRVETETLTERGPRCAGAAAWRWVCSGRGAPPRMPGDSLSRVACSVSLTTVGALVLRAGAR